jgi:TP901 family phage tail tape measure protein
LARNKRIRGITIEIGGDTTKLQTALKGVSSQMDKTQAQLKDVNRLLKLDPGNTELLSQKHKLLGQAVEETKQKLDTLKQASEQAAKTAGNYDAWKAKYDPIKQEITETQTKLKELKEKAKEAEEQFSKGEISKEKFDAIQKEVDDTSGRLKELKTSAEAVSDEFGHPISSEQYDALQREIVETTDDLKKLEKQAGQSGEMVQSIAAKGEKLKAAGDAVKGAGEAMLPVTAAVAGAGAVVMKTTADFDTAMSQVAASMGKTVDEIPKIREKAKELGETTAFSAAQAAEGFNILAQAGLTEEQQLAAIGPVLDLAAAGHIDLAAAASYVTGAVMGFDDVMSNADTYADKIAAGATAAKTDVNMLGEAFSGASANAKSYNQSADTIMVSLLRLAQANVTGSEAGNMLNRTITDLFAPTDKAKIALDELGVSAYDQYGRARDLTEVLSDLQAATAGMSDQQRNAYLNTIFTTNGLKGYNNMMASSTEQTASFYETIANSGGAAARQAEIQLDNLQGDVVKLKSAAEGMAISYGDLIEPIARKLVQLVTQIVNWLNSLDDNTKRIIITVAALLAALGPLLIIIGTLMSSIGSIMTWAPIISGAITTFTGTLLPQLMGGLSALWGVLMANPIILVIALIAAIVAAVVHLWHTNEDFRNVVIAAWEAIKSAVAGAITAVLGFLKNAVDFVGNNWQALLMMLVNPFVGGFKLIYDNCEQFRNFINNFVSGARKWGADLVSNLIAGITSMLSSLWNTMKNVAAGIRRFIGFSEPEDGPLSNFHTYAPDMMKLFTRGILEYQPMVQSAMTRAFAPPEYQVPQSSGTAASVLPDVIPTGLAQGRPAQQTVIMQVDRTQFARLVHELNNEEIQRLGVQIGR